MLKVDPGERMTISDVLERLVAIGESFDLPLKEPLHMKGVRIDTSGAGQ